MKKIQGMLLWVLLAFAVVLMLSGCRSKEVESALIYINQQNDWNKAMEQLKMAVQINPGDVEAHVYLVEGYGRLGDYQQMNEHYATAMKLLSTPGSTNKKFIEKLDADRDRFWRICFNKGVENAKAEKFPEAAADFNNCISIDPSRPDAYRNLAYVNERSDNHEEAIKNYQELLRINPKDLEGMVQLGRLYTITKQHEKAIETMDQILAIDSLNVDAIAQKAMAYDYMGQSDKAFEAYAEALKKRPDDADLHFNLGRLYFLKEDFESAIQQFQFVLDKNPNDLEANVNIGNAYLSMAQNVLRKYREMSDKELAKVPEKEIKEKKNLEKDLYMKAIPYLKKAIELKPDDSVLWNNLGVAYLNVGMEKEGEEAFEKSNALQNK
jgi:tetratricopeptide (TPR) repeat protein